MFLDPQAVTEQLMILLPLLPEEESSKAPMPPPMSNLIYRVIYQLTRELTGKSRATTPRARQTTARRATPRRRRRAGGTRPSQGPRYRLSACWRTRTGCRPTAPWRPSPSPPTGEEGGGGGLHARQERRRHAVVRHLEEVVLLARPGHHAPLMQL